MQLVALRKLRYPRRGPDAIEYDAGTEFAVASDKDAKMLILVRMAREATPKTATKSPAASPAIKTRVMTPDPALETARPSAAEPDATSGSIVHATDNNAPSGEINTNKPNRYRRSDMRSED